MSNGDLKGALLLDASTLFGVSGREQVALSGTTTNNFARYTFPYDAFLCGVIASQGNVWVWQNIVGTQISGNDGFPVAGLLAILSAPATFVPMRVKFSVGQFVSIYASVASTLISLWIEPVT